MFTYYLPFEFGKIWKFEMSEISVAVLGDAPTWLRNHDGFYHVAVSAEKAAPPLPPSHLGSLCRYCKFFRLFLSGFNMRCFFNEMCIQRQEQ